MHLHYRKKYYQVMCNIFTIFITYSNILKKKRKLNCTKFLQITKKLIILKIKSCYKGTFLLLLPVLNFVATKKVFKTIHLFFSIGIRNKTRIFLFQNIYFMHQKLLFIAAISNDWNYNINKIIVSFCIY